MEPVVIRTIEELDNALPLLMPYAPMRGSVAVIDQSAQPVAVLTPDLLEHYQSAGAARLASELFIFHGRQVFLYEFGSDENTELAKDALALVNARVSVTRYVGMDRVSSLFRGVPSREQYIQSGGDRALDEAYERAERVIKGTEPRY